MIFRKTKEENRKLKKDIEELIQGNRILEMDIEELIQINRILKREIDDMCLLADQIIESSLSNYQRRYLKFEFITILQILKYRKMMNELADRKSVLSKEISNLKSLYVELDEKILYQNFGLYEPKYKLLSSEEYKERLIKCRENQRNMIKDGKAIFIGCDVWHVNNSRSKGRSFINKTKKQILRCFNLECDDAISKVKFNNYHSIVQKVNRSAEILKELNKTTGMEISPKYLNLKLQELELCYEYEDKKWQEKEERRFIREQQKEQLALLKEIEEERSRIKKEQSHYNNQLNYLEDQICNEKEESRLNILKNKKLELIKILDDLEQDIYNVDYREANQKAGYVYIISNIGAFGENVFKIGMTRRLNPHERIAELSGASVPFKFDIHALLFSEDAPALETSLHNTFKNKRVNLINSRKEFFYVSLEEIRSVIRENYDKIAEFVEVPEAQQYRETLKIKQIVEKKDGE